MKKLFVFLISLVALSHAYSQNIAINADGSLPNSSAMLDVSSTTKGFLPPRMTLAQRNLINLPATGIIIYQTDNVTGLYCNKGTAALPSWQLIGPAVPVAGPYLTFNTDAPVAANNYIGSGSSGSAFIRFTTVVPTNCVLTSITLSTRVLTGSANTATVWIQTPGLNAPSATALSTTVINGYFSTALGTVPVNAGDLISVLISSSLTNGAAVTVTYQ